jgi:hypothetical protein
MVILNISIGCSKANTSCVCALGLFSVIMRDQANLGGDNPKWIILDGDIDPMWIESLNTVMDDNKVRPLITPS